MLQLRDITPATDGTVERIALPYMSADARAVPLAGETIREFVDRNGWEDGAPLACYELDEHGKPIAVLRAEWYRPVAEVKPVFATMPLGGGGGGSQAIGAIVAMVALMAFAAWAAAPIAGAIGATSTASIAIIKALITVAGGLLISHFIRPKKPKQDAQVHDFQLAGNLAKPGQPTPAQFGRLKFYPDYCDAPFTDYDGHDSVFNGLFCLGVGEFELEEFGAHQTPIWDSVTGLHEGFKSKVDKSVEPPPGGWGVGDVDAPAGVKQPVIEFEVIPPGGTVTLFPTNIAASADVTGQTLPKPYSANNIGPNGETSGPDWVGPFSVNPPDTIARQIVFDIAWPGGHYATRQAGGDIAGVTKLIFEIRQINAQGQPIGSWIRIYEQTLTFLSKTLWRKSYSFTLATPGRYQARAARNNYINTTNGSNTASWLACRAFCDGPTARADVTQIAIRAKADKQLAGYSQQALYCIATRKIPVWTGSAWVTQATKNPIWAACDLWADPRYGGGLDRNDLDMTTLAAMASAADARGDTFNHRFTARAPLLDAINTALHSVRASALPLWNKLSAVRDEPRALPRMLVTDFEIIRGSYQAAYRLAPAVSSSGVVGQYFDETIWRMAEISSTGSLLDMQNPTRVVLDGVTRRDQAYDLVVYMDRINRFRRATHSLELEGEGHLLRRGDLIAVSTELPGRFGMSVRVDDFDGARTLLLHTALDWSASGQRYIRIKDRYGAAFGPVKCARGSIDAEIVIDATDLALVQTQQAMTLVDVLGRMDGSDAPSAVVSIGAPQEFMGLVHDLSPGSMEGHIRVDLVPYAAAQVYADLAPLPPFVQPPQIIMPTVPGDISGLGATFLQEQAALSLRASWTPDGGSEAYEAQYSLDAGATWAACYEGVAATLEVKGFSGADLLLRVRGRRGELRSVSWSQVAVTAPEIITPLTNIGAVVTYDDISPSVLEALHLDGMVTDDATLAGLLGAAVAQARDVSGVRAQAAAASASVTQVSEAFASDLGALAKSALQVLADGEAGQSAVQMIAVASSLLGSGVSAAWEMRVSAAPASGTFVKAGIRVEVLADGTSRIVMDSGQFLISNSVTKTVPFLSNVDGSLTLQGVTKVATTIQSAATTTGGTPVMEIDFVNGSMTISDNS